MILSKGNLKAIAITLIDKAIPVLNNLHITRDGTTIACNGKVTIAVSPVIPEMKEKVPLDEKGRIDKDGVTIHAETIKEVLKNIPKDTLFNGLLEHTEFNNGVFEVNDGKRKTTLQGKVYDRQYVNYKKIFKDASNTKGKRIVLNRKRLFQLLKVIDDICVDSSAESPIYIEFTEDNDILLRAVNYKTRQTVLATMTSYKNVEGKWPPYNKWESKILGKLSEYMRSIRGTVERKRN